MRSEWVGYPLLRSGDDITTELCVPIEDQKALRLLVPLPRLVQLQPDPKRMGIARDIVMDDDTAIRLRMKKQYRMPKVSVGTAK